MFAKQTYSIQSYSIQVQVTQELEKEKKSHEVMLFSFEGMINTQESGDDSKGDPPVPMPNTEVKPLNVDDTWRVTAWESRQLPERIQTQLYVGFVDMARWSRG